MVELVGKVSERGIRRSEVRFLMGTWEFFFVPRSWQDEKHLSLYVLKFHLSKIYIYILRSIPSLAPIACYDKSM